MLVFNKERRVYNTQLNKLKTGAMLMERRFKVLEIQKELNNKWVLHLYLLLLLGILCLIVSLAWLAQM
jgi:hypothetical protein